MDPLVPLAGVGLDQMPPPDASESRLIEQVVEQRSNEGEAIARNAIKPKKKPFNWVEWEKRQMEPE